MCFLGIPRLPQTGPVAHVFAFWWIYCLMVVAIYTGNIISFLTVIKTHPPFDSLRGLLDNTEYKFGILGGSGWEDDFKVSPIIIHVKSHFKWIHMGEIIFNIWDCQIHRIKVVPLYFSSLLHIYIGR